MIQEQGSTVLANFADQKTELSLAKLTNGALDFHIPALVPVCQSSIYYYVSTCLC